MEYSRKLFNGDNYSLNPSESTSTTVQNHNATTAEEPS